MNKIIFLLSLILSLPAFGAGSAPRADTAEARISAAEVALGPNYIINGDFGLNQRSTDLTQASVTKAGTGFGVGSADRWFVDFDTVPTAFTFGRVAFTLGHTDVPGSPIYFVRLNVTTVGSATIAVIQQKIESVRTLAGKTATVSYYAKAGTAFTMDGFKMIQTFGTGGAPSANITITCTNSSTSVGTSWAKYTATCAIPSLVGKSLGSNGDDALIARWSVYNGSIPGAFSFDLSQVMLNEGSQAAAFKLAGITPVGELALAQRFGFPITNPTQVTGFTSSPDTTLITTLVPPVVLRGAPKATISAGSGSNCVGHTANVNSGALNANQSVTGNGAYIRLGLPVGTGNGTFKPMVCDLPGGFFDAEL